MKLLFLIDCGGVDRPSAIATAVVRVVAHFDGGGSAGTGGAPAAHSGWDWKMLRQSEGGRGARSGRRPFRPPESGVFSEFCDDLARHCDTGGAGGGMTKEGVERIRLSLVESAGFYDWDAAVPGGNADDDARHVFVVSPCPSSATALASALGRPSTHVSKLHKRLEEKLLTKDLQGEFAKRRIALHWVDLGTPREDVTESEGAAEDKHARAGSACMRFALESRFGGRLVDVDTLQQATIAGVPVDLRAFFAREGERRSAPATCSAFGVFCGSLGTDTGQPCCLLELHPVFRNKASASGAASGSQTSYNGGELIHRASNGGSSANPSASAAIAADGTRLKVTVRFEGRGRASSTSSAAATAARKPTVHLCPRGTVALSDLPALAAEDVKYFHVIGLCGGTYRESSQPPSKRATPPSAVLPSRWFSALLASLAASSEAMVVDMADPESGVPCTAVLRPLGPCSALLFTLSGASSGLPLPRQITAAGARMLGENKCLCGHEAVASGGGGGAVASCDCAGMEALPIGSGLPYPDTDGAGVSRVRSGASLSGGASGWFPSSRRRARVIPQLADVAVPVPTEAPSVLVKRCRRTVSAYMAATAAAAAAAVVSPSPAKTPRRGKDGKAGAVGSSGLDAAISSLLSSEEQLEPDMLTLPCLRTKGEPVETTLANVRAQLRTASEIGAMLERGSSELSMPTTVGRDEYAIRVLQVQVVLRLHHMRLERATVGAGGVASGGASSAKPATTRHDDRQRVMEEEIVRLMERLGPIMDLQDHDASSFVANVLAPVCGDELGSVLYRVFVALEREDELPERVRVLHGALRDFDELEGSLGVADGALSSPSQDDTAAEPTSESDVLPDVEPPTRLRLGDKGAIRSLTSLTSRQITMPFAKPKIKKKLSRRSIGSSRKSRGEARHHDKSGSGRASHGSTSGAAGKRKTKADVVVLETPAKELESKQAANAMQAIKRDRYTRVVQESPAIAKQREALASKRRAVAAMDPTAAVATDANDVGTRRSPRIHARDAVPHQQHPASARGSRASAPRFLQMSDDGDYTSMMHHVGASPLLPEGSLVVGVRSSPRRSPRVAAVMAVPADAAVASNEDGDTRPRVKRALDL